jgi:hypothetical protein
MLDEFSYRMAVEGSRRMPCPLADIDAAFQKVDIRVVSGQARFFPGTYVFNTDSQVTEEKSSAVLRSLEDKGYGKFVFSKRTDIADGASW